MSILLTHHSFHFLGIGGLGMSALAQVLHHRGFQVTGSDASPSPLLDSLQQQGITVCIGQAPSLATQAEAIVLSSAIAFDHPEIMAASRAQIPLYHRADILAALMLETPSIAVAGSHGKTTSTALLGTLLLHHKVPVTVINGGIVNAWNSNVYIAGQDWIVAEADESDRSMLRLKPTWIVATNLDNDHMDTYGTFDKLKEDFLAFLSCVPSEGGVIICRDDPSLADMIPELRQQDVRVVTYGLHPESHIQASHLTPIEDSMSFRLTLSHSGTQASVTLPLKGQHNVINALGCVAMGNVLGLPLQSLCKGLETFSGVKRRLSLVGVWQGVTLLDDYAHHPREISSTLEAIRSTLQIEAKVHVFFQPHRYSRFHALQHEFSKAFNLADYVGILPIYGAGEPNTWNVSSDSLVAALKALPGGPEAQLHTLDFPLSIRQRCKPGDSVIFMGAGDITSRAYDTFKALTDIKS